MGTPRVPIVAFGAMMPGMATADAPLLEILETSRSLGFLGPGPVDQHVAHAASFEPLLGSDADVVDLGSGGGLPGLVLAHLRPDLTLVLVDSNLRRTEFLRQAVRELELTGRVEVRTGRAEVVAHEPELRHAFDAVVSRSFGPPAVTAECAVGFLRGVGATVLVSEPPSAGAAPRWPANGLAELGLRRGAVVTGEQSTIQVLECTQRCAERFPRPTGRPSKRPLF